MNRTGVFALVCVLGGCGGKVQGDGLRDAQADGNHEDTGGAGGNTDDPADMSCERPDECGSNSVCGADGFCHANDCQYFGCIAPYECKPSGTDYGCF